MTTAAKTLEQQKLANDKSEGKDKKKEIGKKRTKKEQKAFEKESSRMSQTQNSQSDSPGKKQKTQTLVKMVNHV